MKIVFSQRNVEGKHSIKKLISKVVKLAKASKHSRNLLVKVFLYRNRETYRGSYRNIFKHYFYESEVKYLPNYTAIITLKIPQRYNMEKIVHLFAHELAHHLSWVKNKRFSEKTAERFAEKILAKYRHTVNMGKHEIHVEETIPGLLAMLSFFILLASIPTGKIEVILFLAVMFILCIIVFLASIITSTCVDENTHKHKDLNTYTKNILQVEKCFAPYYPHVRQK